MSETTAATTPPTPDNPWYGVALAVVPFTVLGAFAGHWLRIGELGGEQLRHSPAPAIATTLFIVAIIDVLGLVRYVVDDADHRRKVRLVKLYDDRLRVAGETDKLKAREKLHAAQKDANGFVGVRALLPQLAVTLFGIAMAIFASIDL